MFTVAIIRPLTHRSVVQRITLLFFALLLAASPLRVVAQQPQPAITAASPTAAPLAALPAAPDTAAALRRIFAQRRYRGHTALKVGGAVLGVSSILVASTVHGSGYQELGLYLSGILGIAGSVPVLATGIVRTVNYSKKREQRIVQAWQRHHLPRHLKRALETDSLLAAQAQLAQAAALAALGPVAATAAALDTAAALHRLFAAKRKRQGYATGATALVAVGTLISLNGNQPVRGPGSSDLAAAFGALLTLPLIPVVAIGFGGWSAKYERQVIEEWRQHHLSRHIKRVLKTKYFQPIKAMP